MEYVKLGDTGLDVSPICLGCMSFGSADGWVHNEWALDEEDSRTIIKKALDLGVNFFDTANVYAYGASEEILGRALKDYANRDEVVIATKVFVPMSKGPNGSGLSRKHILSQVDQSLKRLGMDYIDIYIIHRWDYNTPIEETIAEKSLVAWVSLLLASHSKVWWPRLPERSIRFPAASKW